ncbi:MAG: gliding motility-associated C-terminal domain-containing protein, partial [Bacteroidetes bacterium]|nr:gliding motility-associated C-terminal domain-containing protein [Bacteroidota bacterium]
LQNDILYIHASSNCIKNVLLKVYNRWGELVFETTDITIGWDGKQKNKQLDSGVYSYYLNATTYANKTITQHGNISLIR